MAPTGDPQALVLDHKIKTLAGTLKWYLEDTREKLENARERADRFEEELVRVRERLSKLEGQHEYMREDKQQPRSKPPRKPEALEALKAVGPWVLGGLALIATLVNALLQQ